MKIISFAWTTPAFLAGRKTRTRRDWSDDYAKRFHVGDVCQAWDHVPRVKGAKRVGTLRITGLKKEDLREMPDEDFEKEGFAYLEETGFKIWDMDAREAFGEWKLNADIQDEPTMMWVVDFEKTEP